MGGGAPATAQLIMSTATPRTAAGICNLHCVVITFLSPGWYYYTYCVYKKTSHLHSFPSKKISVRFLNITHLAVKILTNRSKSSHYNVPPWKSSWLFYQYISAIQSDLLSFFSFWPHSQRTWQNAISPAQESLPD